MKNILLAGSTGYLGAYVLKELLNRGYKVTVIARNPDKIPSEATENRLCKVVEAEVTQAGSFKDAFVNVDTVISTVGITRQKDGLTHMEVDYQANANLLKAAKENGVRKFIYISVFRGDRLRKLKIMEAKEKFVDELKASGMEYTIIRPTGFFSDMADFLDMAKKGKVYLFGDGEFKMNPIDGADLAEVCADSIEENKEEINIGGPDILSQNQIAKLALEAWTKPVKIIHLPDWIRKLSIWSARTFTGSRTYGPIEFFLTVMAMDGSAPAYGRHHLNDFFKSLQENKIERGFHRDQFL